LGKFLQRGEDVPAAARIDLLQNGELPLDEMLPHGLEQGLPLGCKGQAYGTTIHGILTTLHQPLADQFLDGAAGRTGRDVQGVRQFVEGQLLVRPDSIQAVTLGYRQPTSRHRIAIAALQKFEQIAGDGPHLLG
jgi:hypothetical protein